MMKNTFFNKASSLVKRKLVSDEIWSSQEEIHQARAAGFAQQGAWMKLELVEARSLSWSELWSMKPLMIRFLIRYTYNVFSVL